MRTRFGTVAVIGVGLLGGSLGLALKSRGLVDSVRGAGRRQKSLDIALKSGAIDSAHLDAREACSGADLVVLCTPAALVPLKLDEIQSACHSDTVVTDVASTKAQIAAHAAHTWPKPLRFVGSHPMAGSEKFGPEHADKDLYEGAWTIICPDEAARDAVETVLDFWRAVGSKVVEFTPDVHDAIVARTSHVPHILAACIAEAAASVCQGDIAPLIGKGFRDVTRIAAGRPEIWRDICLTNAGAITDGLGALSRQIEEVRCLIQENRGKELEAFFERARRARSKVAGE